MRSSRVIAYILAIGLNIICLVAQGSAQIVARGANYSAREILQRYAEAWLGRKELELPRNVVLAISVDGHQGGDFAIELSNDPVGIVREGKPTRYDIRYQTNIDLLRLLDKAQMSALTAMAQARGSDPIPLNPQFGPDFEKLPDASLLFRRLSFHFWTRGWPEMVPFGELAARQVHGGNAAVFVYDRQIRSAWYQLKAGMHINADPKDQKNNFPQLVIVTKGSVNARLGGRQLVLSEGQAVLIPPGMTHEFWADVGQYGEFVFIAYGEGA